MHTERRDFSYHLLLQHSKPNRIREAMSDRVCDKVAENTEFMQNCLFLEIDKF
jgi:hypothetical protein